MLRSLSLVNPGHSQPLRDQPSKALKSRSSWETQRDGVSRSESTPTLPRMTTLPECAFEAHGPQNVDRMSQLSPPRVYMNRLLQTSDSAQPRQPIRPIGYSLHDWRKTRLVAMWATFGGTARCLAGSSRSPLHSRRDGNVQHVPVQTVG